MAMLNFNVSDEVKSRAESQAAERGFSSLGAYLASLIDADRAVPVSTELEKEMLEGLSTPARDMKSEDWDDMRKRFRDSKSTAGTP
jgi:hypothetical protein